MDKVELIKKIKAGMEFEYLFFWENQPSKRGSVGESCLSQWFPAEFTVDGIVYHCAEQYMMAEKARYFRDKETTEAILQSTSPEKIKDLGRKVRNFNTERWNSVKMDIVTTGNIYKFMQNKLLRSFLLLPQFNTCSSSGVSDRLLVKKSFDLLRLFLNASHMGFGMFFKLPIPFCRRSFGKGRFQIPVQ